MYDITSSFYIQPMILRAGSKRPFVIFCKIYSFAIGFCSELFRGGGGRQEWIIHEDSVADLRISTTRHSNVSVSYRYEGNYSHSKYCHQHYPSVRP